MSQRPGEEQGGGDDQQGTGAALDDGRQHAVRLGLGVGRRADRPEQVVDGALRDADRRRQHARRPATSQNRRIAACSQSR